MAEDFVEIRLFNETSNDTSWKYFDLIFACSEPRSPQHLLFHLAHACFLAGYLPLSTHAGLLFMHSLLLLGFLLNSMWAWNIICAADAFSWNFVLTLLNMGQAIFVAYQMRSVKIRTDLLPLYEALFEPFQVPRMVFKRLVSLEYAQVMSLHEGESYALNRVTKTDKLGILLTGKVKVISSNHFLHYIHPIEFLDSPEFESNRHSMDEKFKVSILAVAPSIYIFWPKSSLEYFFVKEPYLATVMCLLISKDVASKLLAMNLNISNERGQHLDIRLPSISAISASSNEAEASKKNQKSGDSSKSTKSLIGKKSAFLKKFHDKRPTKATSTNKFKTISMKILSLKEDKA